MNIINNTIKAIGPLDTAAMAAARSRQSQLTKPPGSLGRLEELSIHIAGIRGQLVTSLPHRAVIIMAGDHGVATEGVSAYPQAVTGQMVMNFINGGAAINVLASLVGARLVVADVGVASPVSYGSGSICKSIGRGTQNATRGPAMTREQAVAAVSAGIEVLNAEADKGLDIVAVGEMGIGNTTAASAMCACFTGQPVEKVTGPGTGLDSARLAHKQAVIKRMLAVNRPDAGDPLAVLAKVGGFEIGGLAGVMLSAAARRIPVMCDGFIAAAAALLATALAPGLKDYLIAAHLSSEPGHRVLLDYIGLKPLLDLDMRLGEGTGAALGIFLADASVRLLGGMATFQEAGVTEQDS